MCHGTTEDGRKRNLCAPGECGGPVRVDGGQCARAGCSVDIGIAERARVGPASNRPGPHEPHRQLVGLKRLRAVGQILRRVRLSNLPKGKRERLGEKLTKIMAEELRKHDVFRLVEAIEDPTQRALELLDLMAYPALTTRLAQAEARKRAMGYMRRPEFLTDLLAGSIDDGEKARRLIDLRRRLADAGISD